jgi:peptide/nickel transport system permease protein
MKTYILVRGFYSLITLWLLVTIIFAMVRLSGDPVKMKGEVGADAVYLEQLRSRWGLDKSLPEQYTSFMANLLRGDFGHSFEKSLPVREIYFERLPNSLKLGFAAFVISMIIGIPLGMLSALKVNTWWDTPAR